MSSFSEEFDELGKVAYLDHALRGPLPRRALEASKKALEACARGSLARAELGRACEAARTAVAALLGCPRDEVAFVQHATAAIGTLAQAIPWKPGDRVVTNDGEFPSNVLPWRALEARGVVVESVPLREGRLDLEDVRRAVRGARVLTVAAVSLSTGERRDLAALVEIARETGALLVVDAAQALGVLSLNKDGIAALVASSRKWLLGPPEVGILHVKKPLLRELVAPAPGALSLEDGKLRADALRFEGGALAAPLLAGLAASVEGLLEVGRERVEELALARAQELFAGLEAVSPPGSPIVRVRARTTEEEMLARGVVARVDARGFVRLSPHFWNTSESVAKAIEVLRSL